MLTGLVRRTSDGRYHAQFAPGNISELGESLAIGVWVSRAGAIVECLRHAEDSFGWHGSVRFADHQHDDSAPF